MSVPEEDFSTWLARTCEDLGAHSAACLQLDNPELCRRIADQNRLVREWLTAGRHGRMDYLERMAADRADPRRRFPFARSVIVLTFTNSWGKAPAAHPFPPPAADAPVGYVSAYARESDYHRTGQRLLENVHERLGSHLQAEAAVDTKAVYETLLARMAGLGVIGHNGLLRTPEQGTRVFLGCLFVERQLPEVIHRPQMPFSCTACRACLANCPTAAIAAGRAIDARRCISYLTIEKPGLLSVEETAAVGDWLFGCDCCTGICPPVADDLRIPVDLEWLLTSPAGEIRRTIQGTAMAYAGVTRLRRNAVAVLRNQGDRRARELLARTRERSGSALIRAQIDQ